MPVTPLERRRVDKVWGRRDIAPAIGGPPDGDEPLGEIWYVDPAGDDAELLVKYLFTSEKLSVQVHPGDTAARAAGYKRGKDEAWLVVAADDGWMPQSQEHLDALTARLRARGLEFADDGRAVTVSDPWGTQVTVSLPGTTTEDLLAR